MPTATTATPKSLAICADDFGLTPGISAGIECLAKAERLAAISCISNAVYWPRCSPALKDLPASVETGLHINLTEGLPLSTSLTKIWPQLPSLPVLMLRAHMGLLPHAALRDEIRAQWDAFCAATGTEPRYVDGHQHVHHLPGVRRTMLELFEDMQCKPAVRNTAQASGPGYGVKRWLIRNTGGRLLQRELQRRGLLHNAVLLGTYDFRATDYRSLMQGWLGSLTDSGAMLFCHPGLVRAGDPFDAIAAARTRELVYLGSAEFMQDLATANVQIGSVWS
jgi:predicted glycoside hydrolase/deacetylase ChbG (UPF0249 family)